MSGIVVGVDGSHHAGKALDWPGDEKVLAELREQAEKAVAEAAAKLTTQPETVTVSAINGFPAQALIDASKDADLLVVGYRGTGGFAPLALGSVGSQVTHHASCPVVVIRTGR